MTLWRISHQLEIKMKNMKKRGNIYIKKNRNGNWVGKKILQKIKDIRQDKREMKLKGHVILGL